MKKITSLILISFFATGCATAPNSIPDISLANDCATSFATLSSALSKSVFSKDGSSHGKGNATNGGLDFDMWATVVTRDGRVCEVTKTGNQINDQWLGSRVISAQKANTAIAFSTPKFALSTANLYTVVQPGKSLFGLQESNPVDTAAAYGGEHGLFGTETDPMNGKRVGGVNVFGGGLPLYNKAGELVGALGVSGDTSCADHNVAWRVRAALGLDHVPAGVNSNKNDGIIYDASNTFAHPSCLATEHKVAVTIGAGTPAPVK